MDYEPINKPPIMGTLTKETISAKSSNEDANIEVFGQPSPRFNYVDDGILPAAKGFPPEPGSDRFVLPQDVNADHEDPHRPPIVYSGTNPDPALIGAVSTPAFASAQTLKGGSGVQRLFTIDDLVDAESAETLYKFLNEDMAGPLKDWWHYSFHAPFASALDRLENAKVIVDGFMGSEKEFAADRIAYRFRRTFDDHYATCGCLICKTTDFFYSDACLDDIARAIRPHRPQGNRLEIATSFFSYYGPGDFLSPHSDKSNGDLAFVWNLTKDWRPQYGGNLHMLDKNWVDVDRIIPPKFNQLVMFEVGENGIGHFVNHVAPGVTKKRLAYSGWLRFIDKDAPRSKPARRAV